MQQRPLAYGRCCIYFFHLPDNPLTTERGDDTL
jgi:hypothetical protein